MLSRDLEGISKQWLRQIECYLMDYLSWCHWNIDKAKTLNYLGVIKRNDSISSFRKKLLQIRLFLRYLNLNWLDKIKVVSEPYNTPKRIQLEDIKKLQKSIPSNKLQTKALIWVGCDTGLRASELYHLNKSDINLHNQSIHIKGAKTGKHRTVFFTKRTKELLTQYLEKCNHKYLFGESLMHRLFRNSTISIKDLRKFFSQNWDRNNGPTSIKRLLMGHSTRGDMDLMHYNCQSEDDLKQIYHKIMGK